MNVKSIAIGVGLGIVLGQNIAAAIIGGVIGHLISVISLLNKDLAQFKGLKLSADIEFREQLRRLKQEVNDLKKQSAETGDEIIIDLNKEDVDDIRASAIHQKVEASAEQDSADSIVEGEDSKAHIDVSDSEGTNTEWMPVNEAAKNIEDPMLANLPNKHAISEPLVEPPVQQINDQDSKKSHEHSEPRIISFIKNYFTEGNLIVRVGILILLVGLSLMLKLAAEKVTFPIEARLLGVAAAGLIVQFIGWKTRLKRFDYAVSLLGGGAAIFFLTVYFALKSYSLISPTLGFFLLVLVAIQVIALSLKLDAKWLALIGVVGGFLAPILTSDGSGNHIGLFSYYVVLNGIVLATAYYKYWRDLALASFLFTFLVGGVWGAADFETAMFASVEPFLIIFFLMFTAIGLLYAIKHRFQLGHYVDSTLIIGTPIATFAYQWELVGHNHTALSISATVLSAFYFILWRVLKKNTKRDIKLLTDTLVVLATVFGSIAIPLAFSNQAVSLIWAIEGAVVMWLGVKQGRWISKLGAMIILCGAMAHSVEYVNSELGSIVIFNPHFLLFAVLSISFMFSAWLLNKRQEKSADWEKAFAVGAFILAILLGYFNIGFETIRFVSGKYELATLLAVFATYHLMINTIWKKLNWEWCLKSLQFGIIIFWWIAAVHIIGYYSLIASPTVVGWIAVVASSTYLLYTWRNSEESYIRVSHVLYWLTLAICLSYQAFWSIDNIVAYDTIWPYFGVVCTLGACLAMPIYLNRKLPWPFEQYENCYQSYAAIPIMKAMIILIVVLNIMHDGLASPWTYLPILNPLDIASIGSLFVLYYSRHGILRLKNDNDFLTTAKVVLAGVSFLWLNSMIFRAFHHTSAIPFEWIRFFEFNALQATIAIAWTLVAFAVMFYAAKRAARNLWFVGATLLGATVLKLFAVELIQSGTLTRIIAFIVVGGLLLVIGYVSPMPPKEAKEA